MSSSATVRSIGVNGGLGFGQGFLSAEHQLPAGYEVRHLKSCENCNALFTSKISYEPKLHFKTKYCPLCISRMLMPEDHVTNYKEAFPTGAKMDKSSRLPHYDSSLTGGALRAKTSSHFVAKKAVRKRSYQPRPEGWYERLIAAFRVKQALSLKDIAEVMCVKPKPYLLAQLRALKEQKVMVEQCGSIWPRPSCMGKVPRIYKLVTI